MRPHRMDGVSLSFGVLFFTLLNAFGQLVKADFALPVSGDAFAAVTDP